MENILRPAADCSPNISTLKQRNPQFYIFYSSNKWQHLFKSIKLVCSHTKTQQQAVIVDTLPWGETSSSCLANMKRSKSSCSPPWWGDTPTLTPTGQQNSGFSLKPMQTQDYLDGKPWSSDALENRKRLFLLWYLWQHSDTKPVENHLKPWQDDGTCSHWKKVVKQSVMKWLILQ